MSLDTHHIAAASALLNARQSRQTIGRISESHGIAGIDAAYAVAEINPASGSSRAPGSWA